MKANPPSYNLNELFPLLIRDTRQHMGIQLQHALLVQLQRLGVIAIMVGLDGLLGLHQRRGDADPLL